MSGLKNLQARLNYRGGANQQERMVKDKAWSLDNALLYSYQAETIELNDGRQFRCLINPNKLSMELDDKMLSIHFEDKSLNGDGQIEKIGIKPGDTITWKHKDMDTHWIVYLRYLQEKAYFKGLIRQCEEEIEIDGERFWVYLKGPDEKSINWSKTKQNIFNNLNYTLEMYISKTQKTNEFFQRFKICKVQGKNWEVQAVDRISTDGILCVYLKEYYTNVYEEDIKQPPIPDEPNPNPPYISGPAEVYPFDIATYSIIGDNLELGTWSLSNKKARIIENRGKEVVVEIITGKSGDVSLIYNDNIIFNIKILSL